MILRDSHNHVLPGAQGRGNYNVSLYSLTLQLQVIKCYYHPDFNLTIIYTIVDPANMILKNAENYMYYQYF